MEKLTIGALNQMDYDTGKECLEALGYRLTAYSSNEKAGKIVITATFRGSESAVHFYHEFREKRNGQRVNEALTWKRSAV